MSFRFLAATALLSLFTCQSEPVGTDPAGEAVPPATPLVLEPYTYADSAALTDYGPYYTFHLATLTATGGDPALRRLVNDSLNARILHRALPADSTLAEALPGYLAGQFADYRAQEVDPEFLQEAPQSYARVVDLRTEVLYESDSLLVLALQYYEYTGGAHGMSFTTLYTFAAAPPRSIAFDDIFQSGSADRLSALLTSTARAGEAMLYVDTVPVTANVALLPEGVRFSYEPYAIGPYAAGQIAIDLPYDSLGGLLRADILPVVRPFH